ncbi:2-amino-4-hydroxy-6-hydroxymethyldihydropteridine pyrophosphokinase [Burkholderia ubonensis]|uniref:2-amino-4-hydroxy-6-hydroxymethyldihydropteridine pyrophosphokinase n=1 Tax=Burkholderia ubonensis TaxID=101571 RepID=A0A107ANM7_9BURK|nr:MULTISPECIES: 2-amino-4-hydroxy-6-hydroxymethyldihydropteridine diphosphokinase [Burkholderia]AJX17966.1 2-amino-4-hydroxy-6-hydroxymethyldihydropteridine diphosphokinase [Burkholderia ubonensis MSMB22]AOK22519.1 2-amino-4-hydroxy-6-hydroxymethyldihydropteridine pyrophosphokinase [Burkholderia ubonensis]AOK58313.1 2-amino-4-hydroxy-6-hydroxymethyldihydropteridine pyrophosphokinase [Burkholderia ubonensis]KIP19159.1 2-amino-4-hydroxy-6-hydroxymethyldihydropteridine diphosphokinase [Burkholder
MTVAYLGLGANLGDARQTLKDAVVCLAQQRTVAVLDKSSLYRTAPVDAGGDDYYNCAVKIDTTLAARELLALCQKIEHHFGRERPYRNAPRTLDIDILLYGVDSIDEPDLIVPHPRLTDRAFALVPLVELDPALHIPARGRAEAFLAAVASQRIEKVQTCKCPMQRALAAAGDGADKNPCR